MSELIGRYSMSMSDVMRQGASTAGQAREVRVVKPLQYDDLTPQTTGMRRLAAISHRRVGSEALWAGVMLAEPDTASSVHHHGNLETVVYVLSGLSKVRWGNRLEHEVDLEPGDFLFIPPYVPHQEINPSSDQPTQWVVVRSGPEAVVVHLTKALDGQYVANGMDESAPSGERQVGSEHAGQ
jgi:uncharacterized RmlC-like cupin family protein